LIDFSAKCLGAVLGAAIGDALGHPTEFLSIEGIEQRYGAKGVLDYVLFWETDDKRFAPYTDDTQMAEQVFRGLGHSVRLDLGLDATMKVMAERFIEWSINPQGGHRAPGRACLAGCRALSQGAVWCEAGGEKAGGCGSVMRAYPFGLFFHNDLERAESWAVAHSKLTHRDPIALAACGAMAVGIAQCLHHRPLADVLTHMCEVAQNYCGDTAAMMRQALNEARDGVLPAHTLDRLRGWAAHEAIAAAIYVVARHPQNPRHAMLEAINTPGDSDSLGTLVGALMGAWHGVTALRPSWCAQLERSEALVSMVNTQLLAHQSIE
jgi:ADP-ribosylglycohydrolase